MKDTGRWYAQAVDGKKGMHKLGGPHQHAFMTVVRLAVSLEGVNPHLACWKEIEQGLSVEGDTIPEIITKDIHRLCPVLRLSKAFTPKGEVQAYKLVHRECEQILEPMSWLLAHFKMEEKYGLAPRGAMERLLQQKLDAGKGKGKGKGKQR